MLGEYLDGSMEEHLRKDLKSHIAMCDSCLNFLKTYDTTRIICRQVQLSEIPEEFRERLRSFVTDKAKEHRREIEKYRRMAADEQRRQVGELLRAFREGRLSSSLSLLFETHRDRCETCGGFLRGLNGGVGPGTVPREIEEHLAEFLEALPAGEEPFRG